MLNHVAPVWLMIAVLLLGRTNCGGLKCEQMNLCSLGKVKPFLGDIYNSKPHLT